MSKIAESDGPELESISDAISDDSDSTHSLSSATKVLTFKAFKFGSKEAFVNETIHTDDEDDITLRALINRKIKEAAPDFSFLQPDDHIANLTDADTTDLVEYLDSPLSILLQYIDHQSPEVLMTIDTSLNEFEVAKLRLAVAEEQVLSASTNMEGANVMEQSATSMIEIAMRNMEHASNNKKAALLQLESSARELEQAELFMNEAKLRRAMAEIEKRKDEIGGNDERKSTQTQLDSKHADGRNPRLVVTEFAASLLFFILAAVLMYCRRWLPLIEV